VEQVALNRHVLFFFPALIDGARSLVKIFRRQFSNRRNGDRWTMFRQHTPGIAIFLGRAWCSSHHQRTVAPRRPER